MEGLLMAVSKQHKAEVFRTLKNVDHAQWLEYRRKGIGGSDAGTILGVNKYKTPFELFMDKTGESMVEDEAGEAAYWGNQMEEVVAKEFEKRTGKKVRRSNMMHQHPQYDFMLANVDRFVVKENAILECKTASTYLAKEWKDDEIPAQYLAQVQHYLGVTGADKAYIAVLIGGNKFIWKEVDRDEELIDYIIQAERTFWEDHVLKNIPPALDGSTAAEEYLKNKYEQSEQEVIKLKKNYNKLLEDRAVLERDIKLLETRKKEIDNNIKNELKEADTGITDKFTITWKPIVTSRVDTKRLKAEHPEIYTKFLKESSYRKFNVKENK